MRKFLGCVFLTICCHYAQSSRILPSTEYSNEPRHGEYSAQRPQWRTKENFWNFYKPELRTSRNIESGYNPFRNIINTYMELRSEICFTLRYRTFPLPSCIYRLLVFRISSQREGSGIRSRARESRSK